MFLASSIAAFLRETRRVQFIEDHQIVELTPDGAIFHGRRRRDRRDARDRDRLGRRERREVRVRDLHAQGDLRAAGGGPRDDRRPRPRPPPRCSRTSASRRWRSRTCGGSSIVACGTAYHAGVVGRYILEEWARVPVEPDIASEWLYRNPVLSKDTLVIGISQSGETRDTVNAMKLARERGCAHARDHEPDGHADHARGRRGAVHPLRPRDRRRRIEDVHRADRAALAGRAQARGGAPHAAAGADRLHPRPPARAAGQDAGVPRRRTIRSTRSRSATTIGRSSSTSAATSACRSRSRER